MRRATPTEHSLANEIGGTNQQKNSHGTPIAIGNVATSSNTTTSGPHRPPIPGKGIATTNRDSSGPQNPELGLWYPIIIFSWLGDVSNLVPPHRLIVLSFFDGIGTAFLALDAMIGFPGLALAWEVDQACIDVTQKRFPSLIHRGDVSKTPYKPWLTSSGNKIPTSCAPFFSLQHRHVPTSHKLLGTVKDFLAPKVANSNSMSALPRT